MTVNVLLEYIFYTWLVGAVIAPITMLIFGLTIGRSVRYFSLPDETERWAYLGIFLLSWYTVVFLLYKYYQFKRDGTHRKL